MISTTRIKVASGVLLAVSAAATIGSVPVAFTSLFSFDAPGSMSTLSAWSMFVLMISCPFLAFGSGIIALSNLGLGSSRLLVTALAMIAVPAAVLLFIASRLSYVISPSPVCPAPSFHVPLVNQDPRCLAARH